MRCPQRSVFAHAHCPISAEDSVRYSIVIPSKSQSAPKKDSFALDACAAAEKKIAQLGRVIVTVVEWIEAKKHFTARGEVLLQIAQKKIPFRCPPAFF